MLASFDKTEIRHVARGTTTNAIVYFLYATLVVPLLPSFGEVCRELRLGAYRVLAAS
jgi:hypothetical protein